MSITVRQRRQSGEGCRSPAWCAGVARLRHAQGQIYVHHMKRLLLVLGIALFSLLAPVAAQAGSQDSPRITGTWKGTGVGVRNGAFIDQELRFTITKTRGQAFIGIKSWRPVGGAWSDPEPIQGVVMPTGEVRWVEPDGMFIGELDSGKALHGTYMESSPDQVSIFQQYRRVKK